MLQRLSVSMGSRMSLILAPPNAEGVFGGTLNGFVHVKPADLATLPMPHAPDVTSDKHVLFFERSDGDGHIVGHYQPLFPSFWWANGMGHAWMLASAQTHRLPFGVALPG